MPSQQLDLDLGLWTQDRIEENQFINYIRERVGIWRKGDYRGAVGITANCRRLLEY
jgi:type III restriction enzyme